MISISDFVSSHHFDTSHWPSICDLTLTLKQARRADNGAWVRLDEGQCRKSLAVLMHLLDRAVYGNAVADTEDA